MKKNYEEPCMILTVLDDTDIIRTSENGNGGGSDETWTKDY